MGIFIATVEHEKAVHLFLQTFWGKKKNCGRPWNLQLKALSKLSVFSEVMLVQQTAF